ncbi:MAG: hypothetical protein ACOCVL_04100, partial [Candidatus Sumerlaeota bacterium]
MPEVPEKLMSALKWMEKRLRLIAFVLLLALLGGVYYLKSSDKPIEVETPGRTSQKSIPSGDPPSKEKIEAIKADNRKPINETAMNVVLSDNMFSVKAVKEAEERERQAVQLYQQARRLYQQDDYAEAYKRVQEALTYRPNYIRAQDLKAD